MRLFRSKFLNFFPLPHGQGSLRPTFGISRRCGATWIAGSGSAFSISAARRAALELGSAVCTLPL
jgi:hypothetical protein